MAIFTSTEFNSLEDLFMDQLRDIYDAEHRLLDALPKMAEAASDPQLSLAFKNHLEETKRHVERLERVFAIMGEQPKRKSCEAMKGLISEGEELMKAKGSDDVRDAALICAAQRVEHYEMAGYGCLRTLAGRLGKSEARERLQQTLNEEGAADHKLTEIAEASVNVHAAQS